MFILIYTATNNIWEFQLLQQLVFSVFLILAYYGNSERYYTIDLKCIYLMSKDLSFHVFTGQLDNVFCELPVHVFCKFFFCLVLLLICRSFYILGKIPFWICKYLTYTGWFSFPYGIFFLLSMILVIVQFMSISL